VRQWQESSVSSAFPAEVGCVLNQRIYPDVERVRAGADATMRSRAATTLVAASTTAANETHAATAQTVANAPEMQL
jgi:hypothetical protein